MTGRKRHCAVDSAHDDLESTRSPAKKRIRPISNDIDCLADAEPIVRRRRHMANTTAATATPNTQHVATLLQTSNSQRLGMDSTSANTLVDERDKKEKHDDDLVIYRLRDSEPYSKQAAVKGWLTENGLRFCRMMEKGRREERGWITTAKDYVWAVRMRHQQGKHTEIDVGGVFEAKAKPCVAYLRMDALLPPLEPTTTTGQGHEDADQEYLERVTLALGQLQDRRAKAKGASIVEAGGPRTAYLVVVPRAKRSVVRLYTGTVSRATLDRATGKTTARDSPRVQLLRRLGSRQEEGGCEPRGVEMRYREIKLRDPAAPRLFRGFFLEHNLLCSAEDAL